jgi:hypothetical protein
MNEKSMFNILRIVSGFCIVFVTVCSLVIVTSNPDWGLFRFIFFVYPYLSSIVPLTLIVAGIVPVLFKIFFRNIYLEFIESIILILIGCVMLVSNSYIKNNTMYINIVLSIIYVLWILFSIMHSKQTKEE